MTAKHQVVKFREISLSKGQMAMKGKTEKRKVLRMADQFISLILQLQQWLPQRSTNECVCRVALEVCRCKLGKLVLRDSFLIFRQRKMHIGQVQVAILEWLVSSFFQILSCSKMHSSNVMYKYQSLGANFLHNQGVVAVPDFAHLLTHLRTMHSIYQTQASNKSNVIGCHWGPKCKHA